MRNDIIFPSLVMVALVFVGAGCASASRVSSMPAPTSTPSAASVSVTSGFAVDTSDWKTYENASCSISLKYPKDAVFLSETQRSVIITTAEDAKIQNTQEGEVPSAYYVHVECKALKDLIKENGTLFASDSSRIANLVDFFSANTNTSLKKIGEATLGGKPAIAARIGASQWYSLWLDRGNVTVVDFSYAQTAEELSQIQQAILSSIVLTR